MTKHQNLIITPVQPGRFFALTFILSWLIWIPLMLSRFGIGPFHVSSELSSIIRLFGVLMPAASAILLTAQAGGRAALTALFARLFLWRVGPRWWLAATAVQPVLLVLSALAFNLLGGDPKITPSPPASVGGFFFIVFFLLVAVLGEEIGWHGVGLPALQQKNTALKASMILGFLWGAWHLPFWLLLDSFDQYGVGYIGMNFLLIMPLTFYSTWFFNHARFSILLPVAFHLIFNILNTALLPVTIVIDAFWILIVFEWAVTLPLLSHLESAETNSLKSAEYRIHISP